MDKAQSLYEFWSRFLPAYDENTVPTADFSPAFPYLTYSTITDSMGYPVQLNANLWYSSTSWEDIQKKADEIAEYLGYGGRVVRIDGGFVWLVKGNPFAQRMADEASDSIRRIYINVQAEFLTAY